MPASVAGMVQLMADAHQAARTGRHGECRDALAQLEAWSTDSEVDSGIAALFLLIGDAEAARRLLARSAQRGASGTLALGVETVLHCARGEHAASRAVAHRWASAIEACTVEDLLVEDHPGFRLPPAHSRDWHRSQKLLAAGRLRESLAEMDRGNDHAPAFAVGAPHLRTRHGTLPRWEGNRVAHLALLCPDGHGDAFFAWRYVLPLLDRVDRLSVVVSKASAAVLAGTVPGVDVWPFSTCPALLRQCSAYTDWWRLPGLLDSFGPAPYLATPAPMTLPSFNGVALGIVWGGSRANRDNHLRSVPVAALAELLALPGITWHSLMVDPDYRAELPAGVVDLAPRLRSFRDTAAALSALDAVVTIDSSVANLAGAMGKPVLMLAELDGDFRWFGPGDRSAWYPTARVFRQERAGVWAPAISALAAALRSGPR